MPKTAIRKDRDTPDLGYKIRLANQTVVPSPAGDAMVSKQADQTKFSGRISSASNMKHAFGTLRLGEGVCHIYFFYRDFVK